MRLIGYEVLISAVQEHGVDAVYEVLEKLFMEEPIVIIDANGKAVFTPFDFEDLWDYLELLQEKEVVL
jgi:hypothetical protein